jgi:hypothetical protein
MGPAPVAATERVTGSPGQVATGEGLVAMTGRVSTVNVAAALVTLPQALETTQS